MSLVDEYESLVMRLHRERKARLARLGRHEKSCVSPTPISAAAVEEAVNQIPEVVAALAAAVPLTVGGQPVKSKATMIAEFAQQCREVEPRYFIPATPTIRRIILEVALHFQVSVNDILSARREAIIVRPRQIAMYLAKTLTLRSLPEIGRKFGGRDHTTVLHAVRKIAAIIEKDETAAAAVAHLKVRLGGQQ